MRDKPYKPYEAPVQTPVDDLAHATEEYTRTKTQVTEAAAAVEVAERVLANAKATLDDKTETLAAKATKLRQAAAKVAEGL